ncbi:MAG: hypothetical protein P4L42_05475 [Desulfocapsaceae bacterium]|nr:hypothetical protein [Desulfocapsaceae bacterium]
MAEKKQQAAAERNQSAPDGFLVTLVKRLLGLNFLNYGGRKDF